MTRRRVLVALGVWGVLVVSLWASNAHPAVLVLGGAVLAIITVVLVTLDLSRVLVRVPWTRRPRQSRSSDARVNSLRHSAYAAWWSGSTQIADTLVDLVDERLLSQRGIDRASDPAAAMEALTPTLRRLVAGPRRQTATVHELQRILTDVEGL